MLAALAALRRVGVPVPMDRLASPFERLAVLLGRWGRQHGGMLISVTGQDKSGQAVQHEWHLTAGWNEGPEIPCLAAILIAERLANGKDVVPGGDACMGYLELADFEPEFQRLGIKTSIVEVTP